MLDSDARVFVALAKAGALNLGLSSTVSEHPAIINAVRTRLAANLRSKRCMSKVNISLPDVEDI
jgi:hypothetical protein